MKTLKIFGTLAISFILVFASFGQPNYTSNSNGNWNLNTRWTPTGIPVSTSDVTIGHNITADITTVIKNLIGDNGATLTIPEGVTLTISGTNTNSVDFANTANLIVNGTLIVENGNMDFGNTATLTVNGSVSVLNGSLIANNGLDISASGSFYVKNNVTIGNGYDVVIEGSFTVDGNLTAGGGGGTFTGSGTLDVGGTTTVGGTISPTLNVVSTRWLGVGTDWATAANWSKGLPTSTADIIIPTTPSGGSAYPIINSSVSISSLTIETGASVTVNSSLSTTDKIVSDGTLTLNSGATVSVTTTLVNNGNLTIGSLAGVTVTGNFTNSGTVTVKSDASGTGWLLNNASLLGSGTYTVEHYLTGGDFHYIAAPLSSVNTSAYTLTSWGATNPNFYEYDQSLPTSDDILLGWTTPVTSTLTPGKGYALYFDQNNTYTLTGGTPNTGNINLTINRSSNGFLSDGWNLVGNPYLTNISANSFLTANNTLIEGTVYFWEDANSDGIYTSSDYAAWNGAGSVGTGGSKTPNGIIGVGQGFYVRKSVAGSSSLSFTNAMRSTSTPVYFKSMRTESPVYRIKLSVENANKHYSETLIAFKDDATSGFDSNYDAYKLPGGSDVVLFTKLDNLRMSIQTFGTDVFAEGIQIPLQLEVKKTGEHKFKVAAFENFDNSFEINIEDKELRQFVPITSEAAFKTTIEKVGIYDDRFVLHIVKKQQTILGLNNLKKTNFYATEAIINLSVSNSERIETLKIYTVTGKLLQVNQINSGETTIEHNLPKGVYLAVVKLSSGITETHKIAVW